MKTLGVTGGIGSGKTTVCRLFEELGARVFYADVEAKRLMHEHDGVRRDIRRHFGTNSYLPSGELNREYLAERVFKDPRKLRKISHIVHPRVFEAFDDARARAEAEGAPLYIKEAAILFESGGHRQVDAVAVVDVPEEERLKRVIARDAATEAQVRARMHNQLPPSELRRRADFIIDNSGDQDALRDQVKSIFDKMTREGS